MKTVLKFAAVASMVALGACSKADNKAANAAAPYDNKAEAIENTAANTAGELRNQADAIESNAANQADAMREKGDNVAGAVANSTANTMNNMN